MRPKKYTINNTTYTQSPLVLGQLMPLCDLVEGLSIPAFTVQAIVKSLGPMLSKALAIVLVPKGEGVKGRDIEAMSAVFEDHMPIETAMEVISDFLDFNPVSSLLEKIQGITGSFAKNMETIQSVTSSSELSTNSPAET